MTEEEYVLLDGPVNEEGLSKKEVDIGLEVRVGKDGGSGGKESCRLDGHDIHYEEKYGKADSELVICNREDVCKPLNCYSPNVFTQSEYSEPLASS